MTRRTDPDNLLDTLQGTLDLLAEYIADDPGSALSADPLPSLLAQCHARVEAAPAPQELALLHHMACTGGTLIAKCLSVMPNTVLLSEIDPLSPLGLPEPGETPRFRPFDLIYGASVGPRPIGPEVAQQVFRASLASLHAALCQEGRYLCVRSHVHSQFCTWIDPKDRPTLHAMAARVAPVRAVVTVRHPLDSWLSLLENGWAVFTPTTIEEYARRYALFLDAHDGVPVLRYEDFVARPEDSLEWLCGVLGLPYRPGAETLIPIARLSGDSGRRGIRIAPRPRRPVPEDMAGAAASSSAFAKLCERLGYPVV